MKWRTKELLSCLKLSMDNQASLLNHILVAPLRVVGKNLHKILSGFYGKLKVILKVVM